MSLTLFGPMFTGLPSFAPTAANPPAVGARIVSTPQNSSPHSHNRKYTCRPTGLCLYRLRTRAVSPSETCVINGWRGMDSVHLLTACSLRAQPRYSPTVGLLHGCKDCLRAEDFICAIRKTPASTQENRELCSGPPRRTPSL